MHVFGIVEISPARASSGHTFLKAITKQSTKAQDADITALVGHFETSFYLDGNYAAARKIIFDQVMMRPEGTTENVQKMLYLASLNKDLSLLQHATQTYLFKNDASLFWNGKTYQAQNKIKNWQAWEQVVRGATDTHTVDTMSSFLKQVGIDVPALSKQVEQESVEVLREAIVINEHEIIPPLLCNRPIVSRLENNEVGMAKHLTQKLGFTWPDKTVIANKAICATAVGYGNVALLKEFIAQGAEPTLAAMQTALRKGNLEIADFLYARGMRLPTDGSQDHGNTWRAALASDDKKVIEWVLKHGYTVKDIFAHTSPKSTPLECAFRNKESISAQALLDANHSEFTPEQATRMLTDVYHESGMYDRWGKDSEALVNLNRMLFKMGANPNAIFDTNDPTQKTIFHAVMLRMHPPLINLYLRYGADVKLQTKPLENTNAFFHNCASADVKFTHACGEAYKGKPVSAKDILVLAKKACEQELQEKLDKIKKGVPQQSMHKVFQHKEDVETIERLFTPPPAQSLNIEHMPDADLLTPARTPQKTVSPTQKTVATVVV